MVAVAGVAAAEPASPPVPPAAATVTAADTLSQPTSQGRRLYGVSLWRGRFKARVTLGRQEYNLLTTKDQWVAAAAVNSFRARLLELDPAGCGISSRTTDHGRRALLPYQQLRA